MGKLHLLRFEDAFKFYHMKNLRTFFINFYVIYIFRIKLILY